jgi:hypothetical protein
MSTFRIIPMATMAAMCVLRTADYFECKISLSFLTAPGISAVDVLLKPSINPWGDGRTFDRGPRTMTK